MADTIIQAWQSSQEILGSKYGTQTDLKEPPNALALVLNLQHIEVKSTLEKLGLCTPEEIKSHKALRTTFVVIKMLYAGWSFIDSDDKDGKYHPKGKPASGAKGGAKEKLGYMDSDHAILHCYKAENKKGVYSKSKRLDECVALSPGMVVTGMVWGDKIVATFKEHKEDFRPFQFAMVQMYIKSTMASNASESGRMLELKSFHAVDPKLFSPSSFKLLKEGVLANSIQAAAVLRERILDGSLVSEQNKTHLNQALIQGSYSNAMQILCITPQASQGVVALAADGKIKMFLHQPIGDIKGYAINLDFDRRAHHCPDNGSNDEWMAKLLNIGVMVGAVQIILILDSYKNKDVAEADLVYEGFARFDVSSLIKSVIAASATIEPLATFPSSIEAKKKTILSVFEAQGMPTAGKNIYIYPSIMGVSDLDILIDVRKMTNKKPDHEHLDDHKTALVHHEGKWKKGHILYVFFEGKTAFSAVIPVVEGEGATMFLERAKRGLESSIQFADLMKDVDFEEHTTQEPEQTEQQHQQQANATSGDDDSTKPSLKKKQKSSAVSQQ